MDPDRTESSKSQDKARSLRRKRPLLLVLLGLIAVAASIGIHLTMKHRQAGGAAQHSDRKPIYYCPMHTHYRSDKPGNCPICSMKLVKEESPQSGETEGKTQDMPGMPGMKMRGGSENTIFVPPQRQQLTGMRTVVAAMQPMIKEIRTVGKVSYDETKVTHIHTKISGYIEEVFADFVGKSVTKGEPLFTIYSPDLVATQQEYLLALKSRKILKDSSFPWISDGSDNLLEAARTRLRLWDVSDKEIQTLENEGKVKRAMPVYSPTNGVVIERKAYHHGTFVNPEMDLFTIVDLSTVWILGEIYEYDLPYVKVGQMVAVSFPYNSGPKALHGRISHFYPYVDPKTRTTQIRIQFPNPGFALRPDMFVNATLRVNLGSQLVVPLDAVLDTGTQQYVFVDKGEGYVEPRLIQPGPEAGDVYAIKAGLKAGERVVTSANFILDSESRLKGAFANMGKPSSAQSGSSAVPAPSLR